MLVPKVKIPIQPDRIDLVKDKKDNGNLIINITLWKNQTYIEKL